LTFPLRTQETTYTVGTILVYRTGRRGARSLWGFLG